jgi:hypothetical protein
MATGRPRTLAYVVIGLAPWVGWYAAIWGYRAAIRASRDPREYTGTCVRANGQVVPCSYEHWLAWQATPVVDLITLIGGLAAAAISGYVYLRYLQARRAAQGVTPTF